MNRDKMLDLCHRMGLLDHQHYGSLWVERLRLFWFAAQRDALFDAAIELPLEEFFSRENAEAYLRDRIKALLDQEKSEKSERAGGST